MAELGLEPVVSEGIEPDDISLDLVTGLAPDIGRAIMGQQAVLLDPATGDSHLLDGTATIVMQCLDGTSTLREITTDLAAEFGVAQDAIDADVLAMVRGMGEAGLLDGVRRAQPAHPERSEPSGVPVGSDLSSWDGWPVAGADLTVLVNWGTQCGYCTMIGAELADLVAPLAARGAELHLVTTGTAAALSEQIGDLALTATHTDSPPEFFDMVGTPAAYVVDRARRTAEPLAVGAYDVPVLVRRIAGVQEPTFEEPTDDAPAEEGR